jgi:hypothetical protein
MLNFSVLHLKYIVQCVDGDALSVLYLNVESVANFSFGNGWNLKKNQNIKFLKIKLGQ